MFATYRGRRLQSVGVGHLDVQNSHFRLVPQGLLNSFPAVGGRDCPVPHFFQHGLQAKSDDRFVIGDEYQHDNLSKSPLFR